jgi:hypothetical protein
MAARVRKNSELFPFQFPSVFDRPPNAPIPPARSLTEEEVLRPSLQPLVNNEVCCTQCQAAFTPKNKKQWKCEHCLRNELNPYGVQAKEVFKKGYPSNISFSMAAVKSVRNKNGEAPGIGAVVNTVLGKFGSLDDFCSSWYASISAAKMSDAGSAKVLRAHEVLAKLIVDANRIDREEEAVIVSRLSDDELQEKLVSTIIDQLRSGNKEMLALLGDVINPTDGGDFDAE